MERTAPILVLYHHYLHVEAARTIMEFVEAFPRYSRFETVTYNTEFGYHPELERQDFAAIVLTYPIFGWAPFYLDEGLRRYLRESNAFKVAFFQDEYHFWPERAEFLAGAKIDRVYTCFEPEHFAATYGARTRIEDVRTYIPAYVCDEMVAKAPGLVKPRAERRIDVGYRGRQSPWYMGHAAMEKHEIGIGFQAHARGHGLVMDLQSAEDQRLYGDRWYHFLADCKAVLGVEAGVSIIDLDDTVIPAFHALMADIPNLTFDQAERFLLAPHEGLHARYRTLSSRVFEAAALHCVQILFEGHYSGALVPMKHYIPLKKDFSNIDEVIDRYQDEAFCDQLTENAYRDLIDSGKYSYRHFMETFDQGLVEAGLTPGGGPQDPDRASLFDTRKGSAALRKTVAREKLFLNQTLKTMGTLTDTMLRAFAGLARCGLRLLLRPAVWVYRAIVPRG